MYLVILSVRSLHKDTNHLILLWNCGLCIHDNWQSLFSFLKIAHLQIKYKMSVNIFWKLINLFHLVSFVDAHLTKSDLECHFKVYFILIGWERWTWKWWFAWTQRRTGSCWNSKCHCTRSSTWRCWSSWSCWSSRWTRSERFSWS